MQISLSVIKEPFSSLLYTAKMVLYTSLSLSSQAYSSTVLTDLKSQNLTAQDNVVILSSGDHSFLVHTFVLQNVSSLLFNLLECSSVYCEPTVIILPSSPSSCLAALVNLLFIGNMSGLSRSQTDQVSLLLAKEMGMTSTVDLVETETGKDDSDDRSVIFLGNNADSFFPWDVDSDFDIESSASNPSVTESENCRKQLKLETQISGESKEQFKLSFPKSRVSRDLPSIALHPKMPGFQGRIQDEYNNHPVGPYVGPYDQNEKLELNLQLPDSDLDFSRYTEFQHDGDQCYRYSLKSYKRYDDLEKIDAICIETKIEDKEHDSNDESESEQYYYTCQLETCQIPCLCPQCHQQLDQCPDHKMKHCALFDEKEHLISIRNSEKFCLENSFLSKGYILKFPLAPMGVLAPVSAHAGPSAQSPIGTSGNFPARMSAESPSNISHNPSEVISEVSEVYNDF